MGVTKLQLQASIGLAGIESEFERLAAAFVAELQSDLLELKDFHSHTMATQAKASIGLAGIESAQPGPRR